MEDKKKSRFISVLLFLKRNFGLYGGMLIVIIPWLKEHYNNCEVIAVCGNVGQKGELEGLEERAKASGALSTFYGPVQPFG